METITNEEKAIEFATSCDGKIISFAHLAALQMGAWKDEQHEHEKQQWIEKTCEWIKDNAAYFAHWEWNGDTYEKEVVFDAECCVEAFEESIKGE